MGDNNDYYYHPAEVMRKLGEWKKYMSIEQKYPSYSGTDCKCAKCGYKGASVEYRVGTLCIHDVDEVMSTSTRNERLHRKCAWCGYMWDEACIDSEAETEEDDEQVSHGQHTKGS